MCGIAGALAFDGNAFSVTERYVTDLREQLAHRGPDGAATWVSEDGRVGLGVRRLAIIDLSNAAMQPMASEDGQIRLLCNGEIYNHAEIRAELERLGGHVWRTDHSDTEVIVHAFEEWGIGCLERFRGMFALAIWDGRERVLWLVRDRIGVKPLYYSVHHGRLVFASEIKALLADPEQERALDEESLYHYLSFNMVPAPRTMFRGIRKLEPGTWLRAEETGEVRRHRYWDVWEHVEPLVGVSEDEAAERLLDELRTSVRLRKVSDVPVGIFLSGGLDSSMNAALFSEGEATPVKTFSIGFERDPTLTDELDHARLAARHVGAEHHEYRLTLDELVAFLPRIARRQDEPISSAASVPMHYVSDLARRNGVTVAQAGEGADELFLGYPAWTRYRRPHLDVLPVPRFARRVGVSAARAAGVEATKIELLRRRSRGVPVFWCGNEMFTEAEKQQLVSPRLRRELAGLTSWDVVAPIRQRFDRLAWEPSDLNWMGYAALNMRLSEELLMRLDKMGMSVGVEGRTPFLDHKFVELAFSLPSAVRTPDWTPKHILRQAARRLLPDVLLTRSKAGFFNPSEWYEALRPRARIEVERFCAETDVLDRDAALSLLTVRRQATWCLLNLSLWHNEYF